MLSEVYLNGSFVHRDAAQLHLSDLAFLRGYGVFDYFRFVEGEPRFLSDHLDRLAASRDYLGLGGAAGEYPSVIRELIRRNGVADGGIRIVVTGGYADDGYTPVDPNVAILPYAFTPPPERLYAAGCHCILHAYERQLPRAKTIDYIEGIRIQPLLRQRGADFPLYVDHAGNVRESDRSNFMIVRDGRLITPVDDMLLGVTRKHILRLATELGIPSEERAVRVEELRTADEALICSSVKGVLPITRLDGEPVADGKPGVLTTRLGQHWEAYARRSPDRP